MSDTVDAVPAGLTAWESALFRHLRDHVRTESGLIDAYRQVAEESGTPHVAYLLDLIAEDEARHHRLWEEWMAAMEAFASGPDGRPVVPPVQPEWNAASLVGQLEQLLAFEREDAKELRRLRKELKSVRDVTLWPLLVELMEHDTAKHQAILTFLQQHARGTARVQGGDVDG